MEKIKYISIPLIIIFLLAFIFQTYTQNVDLKKGKELYIEHCSKCHRKDGRGIKKVYPPLKEADYIKNSNQIELLRGMLFGRSGSITVNGVTYNGVMITEIDKSVTDADAAQILNYVYKELNNMNTVVTVKDVQQARKAGKLPAHK
ncbi:MAG TPA: cytochrome c [Candidatus Kapabacteria bacterium]|nr:cytochrome c [Candidatus Kapabacteria bacterium]HPO63412.1 cytochrome c [Candidatus Kapabacteria bacterium]